MTQPVVSIAQVDEKQLQSLITTANKWLVFMGPGVSQSIAEVLVERWRVLGPERVKIILDVDPEVARLGYGEIGALVCLQSAAQELRTVVNHQPGLRIGLIMTDLSTLVFSPIPLLIEAGTTQALQPNSITLDFAPISLIRELGWGEKGNAEQTIGTLEVFPEQIEKVSRDLDENPPVKFDVARILRAFNAHFEFVEFELTGMQLSRRTISIPSDLMGLAQEEHIQKLWHSSFRLIGENNSLSEKSVERFKEQLIRQYLISLPGYGRVILRANKAEFLHAVDDLRGKICKFQQEVESLLQTEMDKNRATLVQALLPVVQRQPPARWYRYFGLKITTQEAQEMLDLELKKAFGQANDLLRKMQVRVVFKGVTYELLNDPNFVKTAHRALPTLKAFHSEYRVAQESIF